ncbi:MAG: hypothetical protein AVDCRST_MAG18-516, partial [uncultured Thermomicrobiales bacterium]
GRSAYHRRAVRLHRALRGRGRAADLRRFRVASAVPQHDHPGALERRVGLGAARVVPGRRRIREPHQPPRPRRTPALSRRLQRDGDPLPLRRDPLCLEDGAAGRQPLPDARRGARAAGRDGTRDPLGRGAGNRLRAGM